MAPRSKTPTATTPRSEAIPEAEPTLLEMSPDGLQGWDGVKWRPISEFGESGNGVSPPTSRSSGSTSIDVEPDAITEVEPDAIPPTQSEPAKRRPGRPRKEPAVLDPDAPFRPTVVRIHATALRSVNVGPYEKFEIQSHVEAEPDPHHTMVHNLAMLNALVEQEANAIAERVAREAKVGK